MASEPSTPAPGPNKAQAEFERYTQRRRAKASGEGAPNAAAPGPLPSENLTWAVPLGVGMAPAFPGGLGSGAGGPERRGAGGLYDSGGALTASIGTTVRLGVDLLNAMLSNGVKILGGFSDAYGYGAHGHCGCGCGCGSGYTCDSCCEPSCCEPDCCGCECCHPGVGSCC